MPVVRTVLNPVAGVLAVPARPFTVRQVTGGLVWTLGVTLAGYALGAHIHNIDHYLLPIIAVVIAVSLLPIAVEALRARHAGNAAVTNGEQR